MQKKNDYSAEEYTEWLKENVKSGKLSAEELKTIHVKLEDTRYDETSGDKLSEPFIAKFDVNEFKFLEATVKSQHPAFKILYDPNELSSRKDVIPATAEVIVEAVADGTEETTEKRNSRRI